MMIVSVAFSPRYHIDIGLEMQDKGVSADPGKTDLRCDGAIGHFINSQV